MSENFTSHVPHNWHCEPRDDHIYHLVLTHKTVAEGDAGPTIEIPFRTRLIAQFVGQLVDQDTKDWRFEVCDTFDQYGLDCPDSNNMGSDVCHWIVAPQGRTRKNFCTKHFEAANDQADNFLPAEATQDGHA